MKITEDMVDYISQLSRLQLPAEEKTAMTAELERIVAYMDVLNTLDTTDVEPLSHIFPLKNVLRSDEVVPMTGRPCWQGLPPGTARPSWSPKR